MQGDRESNAKICIPSLHQGRPPARLPLLPFLFLVRLIHSFIHRYVSNSKYHLIDVDHFAAEFGCVQAPLGVIDLPQCAALTQWRLWGPQVLRRNVLAASGLHRLRNNWVCSSRYAAAAAFLSLSHQHCQLFQGALMDCLRASLFCG